MPHKSKVLQKENLLVLLRKIRKQAGLTQLELANNLGKPQSYVSKYESGERNLDLIELRDVCVAVNFPLVEFIKLFEER